MLTQDYLKKKRQERVGSTVSYSSEEMGPSKLPKEVLELGKFLVHELDIEDEYDTLGRWMAHYIAELIRKIEDAKDEKERAQAQKICCETILKLWKHRAALPNGARPLANFDEVFKAICNLRDNKHPWIAFQDTNIEEKCQWMSFAKNLEKIGIRMSQIAFLISIAEANFGKEKKWLNDHEKMLSKEELNILEYLDLWLFDKFFFVIEEVHFSFESKKMFQLVSWNLMSETNLYLKN